MGVENAYSCLVRRKLGARVRADGYKKESRAVEVVMDVCFGRVKVGGSRWRAWRERNLRSRRGLAQIFAESCEFTEFCASIHLLTLFPFLTGNLASLHSETAT